MNQAASEDGLTPVRRALLSVSDKSGLIDFARALIEMRVELVSTGGTFRSLAENGIEATEISALTGFPEMLGGRVKTLHPKVHGGLLGIEHDPEHAEAMREHGIAPIDLVCVNLYPFERVASDPDATDEQLIEQIDIGGPAMLRSAAKNHERVTVVTMVHQYQEVLDEMREHAGATTPELRRELAISAFGRTARYDRAIHEKLSASDDSVQRLALNRDLHDELRYGENPHQCASIYRNQAASAGTLSLTNAGVLHGKALSYNNYNDASGAVSLAWELHRLDPTRATGVVVKHTNPCGAAIADDPLDAIDGALAGDPLAAYGGILATNAVIDGTSAARLCEKGVFLEVIAARAFTDDALDALRARSANVRLLELGGFPDEAEKARTMRTIIGGDVLVQDADTPPIATAAWAHASGPEAGAEVRAIAGAVWAMCKHLSSNAIAIGGADPERPGCVRLFGAGAGQMDRVASCRIAVEKAGAMARGAIAASDAFFPFMDGPGVLIGAGCTVLVQPGGSKRDQETFDLCDERGVTCLTTGTRHFRH